MRLLFFIIIFSFSLFATELAEPKPTLDNPRKVLIQINDGDNKHIDTALNIANNLIKFYGADYIKIKVICFGDGIRVLFKGDRHFKPRVDALMMYDVDFVACKNTIVTKKIDEKSLINGISFTQAGVAEMIERSLEGWFYTRP